MADQAHTPGPWTVKIHTNQAIFVTSSAVGAGDICDLYHAYNEDGEIKIFQKDNAGANALLIAAAPETAAERDRLREEHKELSEQLGDALLRLNEAQAKIDTLLESNKELVTALNIITADPGMSGAIACKVLTIAKARKST